MIRNKRKTYLERKKEKRNGGYRIKKETYNMKGEKRKRNGRKKSCEEAVNIEEKTAN